MVKKKTYGLSEVGPVRRVAAPRLPYEPPQPRKYRPKIALIGCGGISAFHLKNYRAMGLHVAFLCDLDAARAAARAREFYPKAMVVSDFREVLRHPELEVVDVATHPAERIPVIEACLRAGKHVLSQKPFVLDLGVGERLAQLADERQVRIAVNQNGRWAPHWSYLTQLCRAGALGQLNSIDFTVAWDHSWVKDTAFNTLHHLVLYDFGIHWFDITAVLMADRRPQAVTAVVTACGAQAFAPPALASVVIDYPDAQVRINFNAANAFEQRDVTLLCGSRGTAVSAGPSLSDQRVHFTNARGRAEPKLQGTWFVNGFQGAMGELLQAIAADREPLHSARNNLATLELVFAALASAETGKPVAPGSVHRLSGKLLARCQPGPHSP